MIKVPAMRLNQFGVVFYQAALAGAGCLRADRPIASLTSSAAAW